MMHADVQEIASYPVNCKTNPEIRTKNYLWNCL